MQKTNWTIKKQSSMMILATLLSHVSCLMSYVSFNDFQKTMFHARSLFLKGKKR